MTTLNLANGGNFVFAIDTSGGITDNCFAASLASIQNNLRKLTDFRARIVLFDHDVEANLVFTPANVEEITNIEMVGLGGSDITSTLELVSIIDELVVFTDGFLYRYDGLEELKDRTTLVIYGDFNPGIAFKEIINEPEM